MPIKKIKTTSILTMVEQRKMGKFIDLKGERFGKLKVISYAGKRGNASVWLCREKGV